MKPEHEFYIATGVCIAVFIVFLSFGSNGITGAATTDSESGVKRVRLHEQALQFFDVERIIFPSGVCIPAAHDLYGNVAYKSLSVYSGYSTKGEERISTQSFAIDRQEIFGIIDFVKSPTFLAEHEADSLISISSESIIRIPKDTKTTYLVMDLFGVIRDYTLYVTKGRFSTPSTDCIFLLQNGKAYCDCDIHTIKGIAVGGLTSAPAVEERYKELIERAEAQIDFPEGQPAEVVISQGDVIR